MLDALAAHCDRLVRSSVDGPAERRRQRRLIGLALVAPFLIAAPSAILLPPLVGVGTTLAACAAVFGCGFLAAFWTIATGRATAAETVMLAGGAVALAAIVAAAGGPASPAALLLAAPAIEAWWVRRSAAAALAGAATSAAALGLQALPLATGLAGATPSAAHWLIPIAYLAFLAPRLAALADERQDVQGQRQRPLEEVVEAVVLRMDLAGEVTDASSQARRLLGLAPELLLASGLFDRLHLADRVAYLCALADLREGSGFRRVEARVRVPGAAGHAAGDFRPFSVEMMRPDDADAAITLLLRPATNPQREARTAAAKDANEVREIDKTRVLAAVSHELRTPLNAIIGFSDMLLHGMAGSFSDPRQKEYVGLVRDSGSHLLSVVDSILDVSRMEAGHFAMHPEAFRFGEAVELCRSMLGRQAADRKVGLTVDVPAGIGEVHADKRAVKQILINLVSNAIKFTREGGAVTIGAKRIGSRLHFWVSDTGIGMREEDLARVGQPFLRIRNDDTKEADGAGLGLSLVKGLVALHDGSMSIESDVGRGTTVTITLPADAASHGQEGAGAIRAIVANTSQGAPDGTFRKTA